VVSAVYVGSPDELVALRRATPILLFNTSVIVDKKQTI